MTFRNLLEIRDATISKCPALPPLRGRPPLDVAGRFGAVEAPGRSRGAKQTVVGTCPGLTDVARERNRSIVRTWRNTPIKDTANCAHRVGRPPQVQARPDVRHNGCWSMAKSVKGLGKWSAPAAILSLRSMYGKLPENRHIEQGLSKTGLG